MEQKKEIKKNATKGITLLSLTIMIIVLIILASTAIYTGKSTIKNSKFTKFKAQLEIMQAQVNMLYEKYTAMPEETEEEINQKAAFLNQGEDLTNLTNSNLKDESFSGAGESDRTGYRYFDKSTIEGLAISGVEDEYLVNIKNKSVISLGGFEHEGKKYYTLAQINGEKVTGGGLVRGPVNVDKVSYEITKTGYKITLENVQCSKYVGKYDVKCTKANSENYQTVGKEVTDTDYTFEIPREKTANAPKIAEGMIPVKYNVNTKKWVICSQNDPEWYCYEQNTYKIKIKDAAGMECDEITLEIKPNRWANVMLCDGTYDTSTSVGTEVEEAELGSMFVWIPRYAYTISSGYHSSPNGSIDIVWLSERSYNYTDSDGTIGTAKNGNESGATTNNAGYYVAHPAFTNGNTYGTFDNGEWKSEITGIWVAKFQAGFATTANDTTQKVTIASSYNSPTTATSVYYPVFKGRKYAYNYVSASQCYDISQSLDDSGNPYGLSTTSNSHLMKSSEWGVVSYLSISKYGYSGGNAITSTEKYKNNLSIISYADYASSPVSNPNNSSWKITAITGYSATSGKAGQNVMSYTDASSFTDNVSGTNGISYAWNYVPNGSDTGEGTKSSTTGNIYGVYDMGGCLADYTASYVNATGVTNLTTYGGRFANGKSTYLATAYPYQTDTTITYSTNYKDFNSAYPGFGKIFGDALWETSSGTGSGKAWFGQTLEEDSASEVFFPRGGGWGSTGGVGLCGLNDNNGGAACTYGFHSVLAVE